MKNKTDIVIVGIGGVFPGATDLEAFWQNIMDAKDTSVAVAADRWRLNAEDLYAAGLSPDKVNSKRACLIQDFQFDASGLEVDSDCLFKLDPMYQILLHAGRDAWLGCKTKKVNRERVGIIIGNIALPTESSSLYSDAIFKQLFEQQLFDNKLANSLSTDALNRYVAGLPGGLLAKALGLGGGTYTLDAACASSLYSLKYAIDELQARRADAMLAGGLSRPDCLYTQMGFSQLNAISRTGRCSPFDYKADGLVVGEGAGIVVLKRLDDALEQGDHIYAKIAGIGLSNDIEGNIMSPDSEGQLRAMQSAYAKAGWKPNDVQHIECHGTGTPVGDGVEFNSLNKLWQQEEVSGECVIGSVKSNVGHLLTAAGSASLIKTLLAMKHGVLPPTANFEQTADKLDIANTPFNVLTKAKPWEVIDAPRRAAISGFGFGGINAHVLLEEYQTNNNVTSQAASLINIEHEDIAVIGFDMQLGQYSERNALTQALLLGNKQIQKQAKHWWDKHNNQTGHYISEINVPLGRYRIPPAELKEMLPQQLLMLEVAANALDDANLSELTNEQQLRSGVFIGIELDMNTTNFHFRWMQKRYASEWLEKLGIKLSNKDLDEWVENLREASGPSLNANRTMGALGGIVASRIARTFKIGGPSFTVSASEVSGLRALESGMRSLQIHELDHAIVGGVDLAGDMRNVIAYQDRRGMDEVADGVIALVLKRHSDALKQGDKVYAVIKGIGAASGGGCDEKQVSQTAQINAIQAACTDAGCHLDSIDQVISATDESPISLPVLDNVYQTQFPLGHGGAANGLLAVGFALSSLKHRILSADSKQAASYWLKDSIAGPRRSLINASSLDGNAMSVLMEESETQQIPPLLSNKLFIFSGDDKDALTANIKSALFTQVNLNAKEQAVHRAAIIAKNGNEFEKAKQNLIRAIESESSIDDGCSYYSTTPIYPKHQLAFVYPGSGNHFYGMGQELGIAFPDVLTKLDEENDQLASQFAQGRFWQSDNGQPLSHEEVIFGQVWLGTFVSDVVTQFDIRPDAVIGYSLGETAGLFSTRTWTARDEMLSRIRNSKLFTEELAGPCTSVQEAWQTEDNIDWNLGVINAAVDDVKKIVEAFSRVYLLIINTPKECVIGGDNQQLKQVVKKLNAPFHPLSGVTTVHCEVARPVKQAYRDLHLFDTNPPEGISFYSGIRGGSYEVTCESAADSILDQALAPFDYTKVINQAYEDGVRIFIEMGPGGSCTRMIDQILDGRDHVAKAICIKGQDSVQNLIRVLARLYVEGVPINLSAIQQTQTDHKQNDNVITVKVGGEPFNVPMPPVPINPIFSEKKKVDEFRYEEYQPIQMAANSDLSPLIQQMQQTEQARSDAQEMFLRVSQGMTDTISQALNMQMKLLGQAPITEEAIVSEIDTQPNKHNNSFEEIDCVFNRQACLEFAIGKIGNMLGEQFADIDQFPTRVRLPDEPLMLVDRIVELEGEANSLPSRLNASGRVVTEHDVKADAWYLDQGRIPTCIAVESGQADLFLSGYLGIDHITKGNATYRLLDAQITFHGPLPSAGETIRYDIQIDHFFRQGDTWLFRFQFEGTVNNKPLLTMTNGCAGFFTRHELDAGKGIVLTKLEQEKITGQLTGGYQPLLTLQKESFSDEKLDALREGDLHTCFGEAFRDIGITKPAGLPKDRMTLVHRILELDPDAGRYGLGQITGEADIHPDDWFLTCHFVDDQVMPGTLMYECCLHTLRVYLLRMGWIGEENEFVYEPIIGEISTLKCRGQVIETTKQVQYEITLKEIGYRDNGIPYVLADALMYADHRPIVQMKNMSVQLTGLEKNKLETLWKSKKIELRNQVLFDNESILAFAIGKPSEAFGDRYKIFDEQRKIARLPGPPYKFLDRITSIKDCEQWQLKAGGTIIAEYDVPSDEWYFTEDNQPFMPFAVLLEVALQPCGWLAAYLGSALTSEVDLSFRNLGGKATQFMDVTPDIGTLKTQVKITNVSQSGGMIIQNFDYEMTSSKGLVYRGDTYFGFFSKQALAEQIGIRDLKPYMPDKAEREQGKQFTYPEKKPLPGDMMRMVHEITVLNPTGGPHGLGFIEGTANVNEDAWFFKAHFYQDPVWPGSLGLESFLQLLKVFALERWEGELNAKSYSFESMALTHKHEWVYRGQILPTDEKVTIQAVISNIDDKTMTLYADGFLSVDGRLIYQMKDFALRIRSL